MRPRIAPARVVAVAAATRALGGRGAARDLAAAAAATAATSAETSARGSQDSQIVAV